MILTGHCVDVLATLPAASVQAVITSPPYWGLRDYGTAPVTWEDGWTGEIGQEPTPDAFVGHLVDVFRAVRRVLRPDGLLWVNLGDTYETGHISNPSPKSTLLGIKDVGAGDNPVARTGIKGGRQKSLAGIPYRFALAMIDDGWIFRQDIIWHKPNPMPESVTDRCTKSHEYVFLFAQQPRYFWDPSAMREPIAELPVRDSKNRRSVWTVSNGGVPQSHFATFPPDLIRPMIMASTKVGDTVLDPFSGAGTTVLVAEEQGRIGIGIEINPSYVAISERRIPLRLALTVDGVSTSPDGGA